jgi:hypothetical protein
VRVVSFAQNATNFTVSGAVSGVLARERALPSGATLWALNASVFPGRHSLRFSGDLNRELNFTVGVPIPPFDERVEVDLKGEPFCIAAVVWLFVIALTLLSVFVRVGALDRALARVFHDLNGDSLSPRSPALYAAVLWPLWPLFVAFHIRRLPRGARIYAIFLLCSGFVFPFGTTLLDGRLCFQSTFGYFVAGQFVYDVGGQVIGFFYISGIVVASIALLCLFAYRTPRAAIELFLCFAHFGFAILHWERLGRDTTVNWTPLRISLGFHVIPVVTLFAYMVLRRLTVKKRD